MKKAYIEIDLYKLEQNYEHYAASSDKKVIAIVKDNAYGHGLIECSQKLERCGCTFFAVSSLNEALALRNNGIKGGILLLGYLDKNEYDIACKNNISITIYSWVQLIEISQSFISDNLKLHIKINSGMQRNGIVPNQLEDVLSVIKNDSRLTIEGLFTHYIGGESCLNFVKNQFSVFNKTVALLNDDKLMIHAASTNSFNLFNETTTNYVRVGLGLYGLGDKVRNPILKLFAPIVQVYNVKSGTVSGYDGAFSCIDDGYIYTLPIGYSEGLKQILKHNCYKDEYFAQGGKVSMDYSSFYSKNFHPIGEEVELIGDHINVAEIAKKANTNRYDIVCSLSKEIQRKFIDK